MNMFRRFLLLAVCAVGLAGAAHAEDFRVAMVNVDRLMREAAPAKAAENKLQQEFGRREKEVNDLGAALKAATEKFEREAMTLSESQRLQRQRQLVEQDRDFQRKRRELQEDAAARKNEEWQQLLDRVNKAIRQVAEAEKYDLVLHEAAYFNPKHDITDKVLRVLNGMR